jgi:MFS family permease
MGAALTARHFAGSRLRAALSTYNFSGDIGKMALPAATAWLVATLDWRTTTHLLGILGLFTAAAIYGALGPRRETRATVAPAAPATGALPPDVARRGFAALSAIGIVDSATRTGFLTFLPFLLTAKGATVPTIGLALSLVFAGGATGKFVVGIAATRIGVLRAVVLTELATALGILALLPLPLWGGLALLPAIGVALNGTSSVLYGTVAELAPAERRARAFGLFYTLTIGAGALSPSIYGLFSDLVGVPAALRTVAAMVLLTLPLTLALRPAMRRLAAS